MDSDGQMRIDSLEAAWPNRHEYDLLLGYRVKRADGPYRCMMGRVGNSVSNMLLGRNITDINCGFKLFKKDLIHSLTLTSTGSSINFEILRLIFRNNPSLRMLQFPVIHYPRIAGRNTGGDPKVLYKLIAEGVKILFFPKKTDL